jgi:hypothetical protein
MEKELNVVKDVYRTVKSNSIGISFIKPLKLGRERERIVGSSVRHYI